MEPLSNMQLINSQNINFTLILVLFKAADLLSDRVSCEFIPACSSVN